LDTLSIFQLIFIGICLLAVIAMLAKMGYYQAMRVVGILIGILVVAMILIITNRALPITEKVQR
jgi:hypothetical protein